MKIEIVREAIVQEPIFLEEDPLWFPVFFSPREKRKKNCTREQNWKKWPWKKENPSKSGIETKFLRVNILKNDISVSQIKSGQEKSQKRAKLLAWNENVDREQSRKKTCKSWWSRPLLSFTGKKKLVIPGAAIVGLWMYFLSPWSWLGWEHGFGHAFCHEFSHGFWSWVLMD